MNQDQPVSMVGTIAREHEVGNVGHLAMKVEDYTLLDVKPEDYRGNGFTADFVERNGGTLGLKIMNRFNDVATMKKIIELVKNGLPPRTDIFGLKEEEVVLPGLEPISSKKFARYLLTKIHTDLTVKANLDAFVAALEVRITKLSN